MLASILLLIVGSVCGFFTATLLLRFLMQYLRVSFRNPLGAFVIATTDWAVTRLRRVVPGFMGLDFASLLPAWVLQSVLVAVELAILSPATGRPLLTLLPLVCVLGVLELVRFALFLLMGIVFVAAILSWVSPHSPVAPVADALSAPFLRPIRRILPLMGGVDLSPLVLLLLLQIAVMMLGSLRAPFFGVLG